MWQFDGQSRVDPGGSCRVWTGTCADGSTAFLKWHPEPRSWSQEQQAIRVWLPQISQQLTQRSELIASDEGERLLLLSAVAGEPVESRNWSLEELCHIHHQAGVFLGELHRLEAHDDDPVSLDVALPKRLETWITKSDDILEEKQILRARQSFVDGNLFAGDQRTLAVNGFGIAMHPAAFLLVANIVARVLGEHQDRAEHVFGDRAVENALGVGDRYVRLHQRVEHQLIDACAGRVYPFELVGGVPGGGQ